METDPRRDAFLLSVRPPEIFAAAQDCYFWFWEGMTI